jgi:hypothetical protein
MANCKQCGAPLDEGTLFCGICGAALNDAPPEPAPGQQQYAQGVPPQQQPQPQQQFAQVTPPPQQFAQQPAQQPPTQQPPQQQPAQVTPPPQKFAQQPPQQQLAQQPPQQQPAQQQFAPQPPQQQQFAQTTPPRQFAPQTPQFAQTVPTPVPVGPGSSKKSSGGKKAIIAIVIVLIVLAILAIVWFVVLGGRLPFGSSTTNDSDIYYGKDNNIYFSQFKEDTSEQLTDRLYSGSDFGYGGSMAARSFLGIQVSADGKQVVYPDRIEEDNDGYTYYLRKNKNSEKDEAQKIDSNMGWISVADDFKSAVYSKYFDGATTLYSTDFEDREKIDSDVADYRLSDDFKRVVYSKVDGGVYVWEKSTGKEKIDAEGSITYVSDDANTVFFRTDDAIYVKQTGKDKVKIATDVYSVFGVSDSGTSYYSVENKETVHLSSFVDDDMADADSTIKMPTEPEYPDWYSDNWDKEYEKYQKDSEKYYEDMDVWYAKSNRDDLRRSLNEATMEISNYTLYYFDGQNNTKVTDNFVGSSASTPGIAKNSAIVYSKVNVNDESKIKLSDVYYTDDVEEWYNNNRATTEEHYIAAAAQEYALGDEAGNYFTFSEDGVWLAYLDGFSDKNYTGTLYRSKIGSDAPTKPESISDDVYKSFFLNEGGDAVYYTDVSNRASGDLHIGDFVVDSDVAISSAVATERSNYKTYYYFTNWDVEHEYGTLNRYEGGKKGEKIADDVHSFYDAGGSRVVVMTDYNANRSYGDVMLYNGGKEPIKIANDAAFLLPPNHFIFRGDGYLNYDAPVESSSDYDDEYGDGYDEIYDEDAA